MSKFNIKTLVNYLPENNRIERIWKISQVDFKKRYYNDSLGIVWALINPIFRILIYYVVFTQVFKSREDNFILFLFSGLIIWMGFSEATKKGINVFKSKRYLLENIQFEKIDLFIAHVLSVFFGMSFNFLIYIIFSFVLGVGFGVNALYFILVFISLFVLCIGVSMILTVAVGLLKDISHLWDIALLAGFWGSGIFYSAEKILEPLPFAKFNPILGMITNTRETLLLNTQPDFFFLIYSFFFSLLTFIVGYLLLNRFGHLYFEKM